MEAQGFDLIPKRLYAVSSDSRVAVLAMGQPDGVVRLCFTSAMSNGDACDQDGEWLQVIELWHPPCRKSWLRSAVWLRIARLFTVVVILAEILGRRHEMPWFTARLIWGSRWPASLWGYRSLLHLLPNQLVLMCVSIFRHFLAWCHQILCTSMTMCPPPYLCTCENKETDHLHHSYFFFSVALEEI